MGFKWYSSFLSLFFLLLFSFFFVLDKPHYFFQNQQRSLPTPIAGRLGVLNFFFFFVISLQTTLRVLSFLKISFSYSFIHAFIYFFFSFVRANSQKIRKKFQELQKFVAKLFHRPSKNFSSINPISLQFLIYGIRFVLVVPPSFLFLSRI